MTTQKQRVPALRFPEFSGEWEEKKLGDLVKFENGKAHEQFIDKNGKFIVVNSKFVSTQGSVKKYSNTQISPLLIGDIVMVMSDVPKGKALAKCFMIDENNAYTLNQRICSLRTKKCVYPDYLLPVLSRNSYYLKYDSGVTQTNLKKSDVLNCPLLLPTFPEQQKIASFLSSVDTKIEQLTKKKAKLEKYKKGMMQKLFSQEIRFKDDEGKKYPDWEKSQLIGIADKNKNNSFIDGDWIESPHIKKSGFRLLQTGNIGVGKFRDKSKKYISSTSYTELKCKEVEVGDLLICRLAEPAGRACVVPDLGEERIITSVDVTIIKVDSRRTSAYFVSEYFSLPKTLYEVLTLCGGSTRTRIARSNLAKIQIPLPSLPEQQKITDFLSSIDDKIERVGQELEKAKTFKKGLLQQMFV